MTSHPETQAAWWCADCEQITDPIRVYECSTCGEVDDDRRCTQCNRFKARREEDGCETCYAEVHEIETVIDHDGTVIPADQYDPDGQSLADRETATRVAADAEARHRREAWRNEILSKSHETTWSQVQIGDAVLTDEALNDRYGGGRLPVVRAITPAQGHLVITTQDYSIGYLTVAPSDPVRVSTDTASNSHADRCPFGRFILEDEDLGTVSSPAHTITVQVGHSTRNADQPQTPVILLRLHGNNISYVLGYWHDPVIAAAALDVLDEAAARLAKHLGVTLDPGCGVEKVTVTEKAWLYEQALSQVGVRVGFDDAQPKHRGLVAFSLNGRHSASFADPHALAAAVAATRNLLSRLVQP